MDGGKVYSVREYIGRHGVLIRFMYPLLWIVGTLFFVLFLWVAGLNASVLWIHYVQHKRTPSWIPLLGGIFGVLAVFAVPIPGIRQWWWLPLLLDFGSIPGFIQTFIYYLIRLMRKPMNGE